MSSKPSKLIISALALSFTVVIAGSATTERLWPWIPVGVVTSSVSLLLGARRLRTGVSVALAVCVGVGYRAIIFLFPASYIGLDPDRVASAVAHIVTTGTVSSISALGFYSKAPLFHLFASEVTVVTGLPVRFTVGVPAALLGLIGPLVVVCFIRRLTPSPLVSSAAQAGAIIAATGTVTWKFGYWPLPQVEATLLWGTFVLTLFRVYETQRPREWGTLLLCLVGLMFSHKTGLLIAVAALGSVVVVKKFTQWQTQTSFSRQTHVFSVGLLIAICLFAIQFVYLTQWVQALSLGIIAPFVRTGVEVGGATPTLSAANPLLSGITGILLRNVGWLVITSTAALLLPILWWHVPNQSTPLVGVSLAVGGFVGVSLLTSFVSIDRMLLMSEWVFVAVIFAAVSWIAHKLSTRSDHLVSATTVVAVLATILICSQAATATVSPDSPTNYRKYLTAEEVTAKGTITSVAPQPVAADAYYAHEITPKVVATGTAPYITGHGSGSPGMKPMPGLYNASFDEQYIVIRRGVHTVRGINGAVTLQYKPYQKLKESNRYGKVYDGGSVTLFKRQKIHNN